ncbi:MAG TPA: hypothetical protein V6C46_07150, partial [Coleofasciculaceae cyanobacterium]
MPIAQARLLQNFLARVPLRGGLPFVLPTIATLFLGVAALSLAVQQNTESMALLSLAALGVAIALGLLLLKLKQVEEALRQSEASLLQVQRIAHLGSWELDLATQQLTWSEEMFRIAGIAPT